jgi:hypothetical protein
VAGTIGMKPILMETRKKLEWGGISVKRTKEILRYLKEGTLF